MSDTLAVLTWYEWSHTEQKRTKLKSHLFSLKTEAMKKLNWTKESHPIWGECRREQMIREFAPSLHWPEFQWKADKFSIIYPRPESSEGPKRYELYDGEDIYIFDTLEEAQQFAEKLSSPKPKPIPTES